MKGTSSDSDALLAAAASSFGFSTIKFEKVNLVSKSELIELKISSCLRSLFLNLDSLDMIDFSNFFCHLELQLYLCH